MNWRMYALAAALFLAVPVGIGATQNPVLDLWAEGSAIISDVELFDPPRKKVYDDWQFVKPEQVVEGHTTFVTIEMVARYENVTGNVTIDGVVHCEDHVEYEAWYNLVPTRVKRAQAECYAGQRVVVTPDPFSGDPGSLRDLAENPPIYRPTGSVYPILTPDGQMGYVEELSFDHLGRTYFAWATPVFQDWTWNGKTKNFIAPLPVERLLWNDADDYRVVLENDLRG